MALLTRRLEIVDVEMQLTESTLRSPALGNERRVWLQPPEANRPPRAICVLLDGEYYLQRVNAPALIAELQTARIVPPLSVAYVSHVDSVTRWKESACSESFAGFVADELVPWVESQFRPAVGPLPVILGGLSLTGLAAAHVVLCHPNRFSGVFCQSASFWWSHQWLIDAYRKQSGPLPRFRICCGSQETTEYVEHGPDMIQRTSQLAANRAMRDVLADCGCELSYEEFAGGHDIDCWRADLPRSLAALLSLANQQIVA
ncbi:MAG TPA: alpha/beta hydrolase-fold protein [Pirellulales bacterium]|nr:alpha/beta hydrolase-fold protein [Pirellulales bacterium]